MCYIDRQWIRDFTAEGETWMLTACSPEGTVHSGGVPLTSQPGFAYDLTIGSTFTATNWVANKDWRHGLLGNIWGMSDWQHVRVHARHPGSHWLAVAVTDYFIIDSTFLAKFRTGRVLFVGSRSDAYDFIRANPACPPSNWWHPYLIASGCGWTPTVQRPVEEWSG
jgi:hypothetical protein